MVDRALYYILDDDNKPLPATLAGYTAWAHQTFMKEGEEWTRFTRQTAEDFVGGLRVSTVFLGIDHNFGSGPPVLWETMVFSTGESLPKDAGETRPDLDQRRYRSHEAALKGHQEVVELVKESLS